MVIHKLWRCMYDAVQASVLVLYLFLLRGLSLLRGLFFGCEKIYWHMCILVRVSSLGSAMRFRIDWLLGNQALALSEMQNIIMSVEVFRSKEHTSRRLKAVSSRVLLDLYQTLIGYCYKMGAIENAMAVIIRAQKVLQMDELSRRVGICHKTAEIIQVTISASKILEGGNVAALLYKEGLDGEDDASKKQTHTHQAGKVIPFPFRRIKADARMNQDRKFSPLDPKDRS